MTTVINTKRTPMILTDRACQKRVAKREKIYDRKCPGLYVSIIPAGVATLISSSPIRAIGKQRSTRAGRLQSRNLHRRGCPQQGLRAEGRRPGRSS